MKQSIINVIFIIGLVFSVFSLPITSEAKEEIYTLIINKEYVYTYLENRKQIPIDVKRKAYKNIEVTRTTYSVLKVNYTKSPRGGDFY